MHPPSAIAPPQYRGRLAPSPTGYLHLGHARTFWAAQERARARGGELILRNEDLDATRFQMEFVDAMLEDLRWFGFAWSEGPDVGGPCAPYHQSERMDFYRAALERLRAGNFIYPCTCSRKDIQAATRAPHANDDDEPIYPGTCREKSDEWRVTSGKPPQARHLSPVTRHFVFAFRMAKPFLSPTEIWANGSLSPEKTLAILLSGAAMVCRPISLRVWWTTRDADHRSRARGGSARQHRAADFAVSRPALAGAGFLSLRTDAGRIRRAAGEAARRLESAPITGRRPFPGGTAPGLAVKKRERLPVPVLLSVCGW